MAQSPVVPPELEDDDELLPELPLEPPLELELAPELVPEVPPQAMANVPPSSVRRVCVA